MNDARKAPISRPEAGPGRTWDRRPHKSAAKPKELGSPGSPTNPDAQRPPPARPGGVARAGGGSVSRSELAGCHGDDDAVEVRGVGGWIRELDRVGTGGQHQWHRHSTDGGETPGWRERYSLRCAAVDTDRRLPAGR